ncbi:MAG TPA: GGDEF domain-containing protein [Actinomycetota bacterium]|nr:GGDEF domain-containing protein [Actinomycetota bacterium]
MPTGRSQDPYALLALMLVVGSVSSLLFSFTLTEPAARQWGLVAAPTFLLVAVMLWFVGPRVRRGWGLDAGISLTAIIALATGMHATQPESQVLVGLLMIVLAVFAAYFRPPARFLGELALMLGLYSVVVLVVQPILEPAYWLVVILVTAAVSVSMAILVSQLRDMAQSDTLTGVLNRRGLATMAQFCRAEAQRSGSPLSVALIDIDHFKMFNDQKGHLAGDRLLIDVASNLSTGLRQTDVVARFGGDEFALVLRAVDARGARDVLQRIPVPAGASWSAGVADWDPAQPLESALHVADRELYRVKHLHAGTD